MILVRFTWQIDSTLIFKPLYNPYSIMAPIHHRGEGLQAQASRQYDNMRLMSLDASERFHNVMVGKKLIQERGLQAEGNEMGHIATMIHERK